MNGSRRLSPRLRALRDGLVFAGLLFGIAILIVGGAARQTVGADAYAYWSVNIADPYAQVVGAMGAYLYSPVVARLFAPAALLPWPAFWLLWTGLLVGTVLWLGGRRRVIYLLAFPPVLIEIYYGNVNLLIAAAIALGFRYPATWAWVLLTKATPGVGLLWFVVRREWRQLAIALGVTGALVAVSLVVDGRLWPEWLSTIGRAAPPPGETLEIPLWIRVPAAAVLVVWGALANRRWTVVVAATIALPVLWLATCWSVLAALAAIDRPELQGRPGRAAVGRAAAGRAAGPVREGPLVGMHVDGIQATGSRPVRSSSASGYAVDAHTDAVPLGRAAITDEAAGPGRAKAGLQ